MSLESNRRLAGIITTLASSPAALAELAAALEESLGEETHLADSAAREALFHREEIPTACVRMGRCDMLRALIKQLKSKLR